MVSLVPAAGRRGWLCGEGIGYHVDDPGAAGDGYSVPLPLAMVSQLSRRALSALVNAPDHLYEKLLANWPMRYWDPWRAYLAGSRREL
jgi:hypothetical protein